MIGREIFDSRGYPTLECELVLQGGLRVLASVPSGRSKSSFESLELRDEKRLLGHGVNKAIEKLENDIAPLILGNEPDLIGTDLNLIELDGTENRANLGANTMLAASIAVCRAQALSVGFELYDFIAYLCDYNTVSIPFPMFNMINGGAHADTNFPIQEILLIPTSQQTFRAALESTIILSFYMKELLKERGFPLIVGDEGGFVADFKSAEDALDLVVQAANKTNEKFIIGLDVAANQLYDHKNQTYRWFGKQVSRNELIDIYDKLSDAYPISSIEDGLIETDVSGWRELMKRLGEKIQIIGDDIFSTKTHLIAESVRDKYANGAVIKPNQVGTVTEALQAAKFCKEHEIQVVASHRSGETNDPFIADFAIGVSASYLKAGGCNRGERLAKYNHLLRVEDALLLSLLE